MKENEVDVGGEYLAHEHTLEHCRFGLILPFRLNKPHGLRILSKYRQKILERGGKCTLKKRLAEYIKHDIDSGIEKKPSEYAMKRRSERRMKRR